MFFIQFFIGSFVVVVVELWKFFIYSGYKPFIRSMILKYYILFYELLFFFFGCTGGIWKFPGQDGIQSAAIAAAMPDP